MTSQITHLPKSLSCVWLFGTPWTIAHQAPLSMEFSRQEYWSGLVFPSPGDLPTPGIECRVSCIAGRFFIFWASREAYPPSPAHRLCSHHNLSWASQDPWVLIFVKLSPTQLHLIQVRSLVCLPFSSKSPLGFWCQGSFFFFSLWSMESSSGLHLISFLVGCHKAVF